ncbi:MAG: hypothetical protein HXS44_10935 [Theionarchaea archaeon]|nr:hypothetical protein [Theionarchaea archaeon]
MDKDTYFRDSYRDLMDYGFQLRKEKIDRFNVVIATKKEFSISSEAVYMNIFVIMAFMRKITEKDIKEYFTIAHDYIIEYSRDLEKTLEAESVFFAILASHDVSEEAKQWVLTGIREYCCAYEMPLIYDMQEKELYYCRVPEKGVKYYEHFHDLIDYLSTVHYEEKSEEVQNP